MFQPGDRRLQVLSEKCEQEKESNAIIQIIVITRPLHFDSLSEEYYLVAASKRAAASLKLRTFQTALRYYDRSR